MKNYKIVNDSDYIFKDYRLTELMLLKKNGRKNKITENMALYYMLVEKFEEYGLRLFGQFEREGLIFRGLRLLEDFPIENEEILKQCYGYEDFIAHVQLAGFDDFSVAFDYHTTTGECELQKHSWGSVKNRITYNSLSEMLEDIKDKGYDKIFN